MKRKKIPVNKITEVMKTQGKPMSTPEIDAMVRGKVTSATMKHLEKMGLVEKTPRYFRKPFDKVTMKPIDYADLKNYDKDQIIWIPTTVYIWKLTKKGLKYAS